MACQACPYDAVLDWWEAQICWLEKRHTADVCTRSSLARRGRLGASSMMPSLMVRPNSFQKVLYFSLSFVPLLSPSSASSADEQLGLSLDLGEIQDHCRGLRSNRHLLPNTACCLQHLIHGHMSMPSVRKTELAQAVDAGS